MEASDRHPDTGRNETEQERLDRKWIDLLQELRVMQTGTQLIAGFLLTLPFQQRFEDLTDFQRHFYLGLVLVATLTTATVIGPVAVHRKLSGSFVKERVVDNAHRLAALALAGVGLLITGITFFIFDIVQDRTTALVAGGGVGLVVVGLLLVRPLVLDRLTQHEQGSVGAG